MKYIEVRFSFSSDEEYVKDLLSSELGDLGFESFSSDEEGMVGYVQASVFDESALRNALADFSFDPNVRFEAKAAEDKDWNEEWEKNYFQPIVIGDECVVHGSFHKDVPPAKYDIVINPKMAFGTGYHATTTLMMRALLRLDVKGKRLLDMGCGTAILAILAAKKGATEVVGIDIDEWAYENAKENIVMNGTPDIELRLGGAEALKTETFDVILANINRNILLQDIRHYVERMRSGSLLFLSGFYESDIPVIEAETAKHGLRKLSYEMQNDWVAVQFEKV
ncbi:MAG: 50S ribosomal protein L11 methyltransferase [Paludibacteraceae bacterium]|nr:50S ribosomal protein L11 methyltransferase [Paludibacteraceae bacterium]